MRTDLSEDPVVIAMAARLHIDEFSVVGRLHRIWSWADRQLADGLALGISTEWIDQYVRLEGFSNSLLEIGWLIKIEKNRESPLAQIEKEIEKDGLLDPQKTLLDFFSETFLDSSRFLLEKCGGGDLGGVVFPSFFRFLGSRTTKTNTKTNTKTTPTRVRENEIEKIEKAPIEKEIEKGSSRIEKDEAFSIFWKQYPRKDSKVPAQKAYEKLAPDADLQQQILDALARFKACDQWVREDGKFIPFASTWLNQRRWEDETTPATAASTAPRHMTQQDRIRLQNEATRRAYLGETIPIDARVIDMEQ